MGAASVIMFPPWRFKLREAQVALEQGRLEEAARLASDPQLKLFLPVQQLLVQIGEQFARRALERAASGDFTGGWRDLDEARSLAGETGDAPLAGCRGRRGRRHAQHLRRLSRATTRTNFENAASRLPLKTLLEVTRRLNRPAS
jgi:hypothetical protein